METLKDSLEIADQRIRVANYKLSNDPLAASQEAALNLMIEQAQREAGIPVHAARTLRALKLGDGTIIAVDG